MQLDIFYLANLFAPTQLEWMELIRADERNACMGCNDTTERLRERNEFQFIELL